MERTNFFNRQSTTADDLNAIESTKVSQIAATRQAALGASGGWGQSSTYNTASVLAGGIYGSPADAGNTGVNFYCLYASASSFNVATGKALNASGEYILCSSGSVVQKGVTTAVNKWTSAPSVLNYVKLRYQEASGSAKSDGYGNTYYTRYSPSYFVEVNGVSPTTEEILLATFLADGSGDITGSSLTDRRQYVRTITPANAVILDPTVKPVSAWTTVEDHVRAVGTGTPAQTNPHGTTISDISGQGLIPPPFSAGYYYYISPELGTMIVGRPGVAGNALQNTTSGSIFVNCSIYVSVRNSGSVTYQLLTGTSSIADPYGNGYLDMFSFTNYGPDYQFGVYSLKGFVPKNWYFRVTASVFQGDATHSLNFYAITRMPF